MRISETASEFYANHLQVLTTRWDFTLLFGLIGAPEVINRGGGDVAPGEVLIDAIVRTSPQHAKAIMETLERTVAAFESEFGVLPSTNDKTDDKEVAEDD